MDYLYKVIAGSKLYGLNEDDADTDIMGVYMPSNEAMFGLPAISKAKTEKMSDDDITYYSLHHFGRLLSQGNFLLLEILFAPADKVLLSTPAFTAAFVDSRDTFLSGLLLKPLLGFAKSNLNKIYTEPKSERRAKYFREAGYDAKYLMHCLRILRVGIEYAQTGKFRVDWSDLRDYFLDIKHGRRDLAEVLKEAEHYQEVLNKYLDNYVDDSEIIYSRINEAVMEISLSYILQRSV